MGQKNLFIRAWFPCSLSNRYLEFLKSGIRGKKTYSFMPGPPAAYLIDT